MPSLDHSQPDGVFDAVLVDAPCSGSGTWRRQPEQRWRMTPAWLAALTEMQDRLLDQAAPLVRPPICIWDSLEPPRKPAIFCSWLS